MSITVNPQQKQFTKQQKITILDELKSGYISMSVLARKHGIHPNTIYKWKVQMGTIQKGNSSQMDIQQLLANQERDQQKITNLQKALADVSVECQIFKTANEILKKNQISQKLNSPKKRSKS